MPLSVHIAPAPPPPWPPPLVLEISNTWRLTCLIFEYADPIIHFLGHIRSGMGFRKRPAHATHCRRLAARSASRGHEAPRGHARNEAALAREQRQQQRLHSYGKRPQRGDWTIPSPHFGSGGHFSRHGGRQRGFLGEASGKKHAMQEYDEVLRVKAMRSGGKIDG